MGVSLSDLYGNCSNPGLNVVIGVSVAQVLVFHQSFVVYVIHWHVFLLKDRF
jgi:hypothetical protein